MRETIVIKGVELTPCDLGRDWFDQIVRLRDEQAAILKAAYDREETRALTLSAKRVLLAA